MRFWVHANTHGIARSDSIDPSPPRDGGREPMLRSASASIGVTWKKNRAKSGSS
jgi:hypothetical protein